MAGETQNIAEMASKISTDVFGRFGWKISGTTNENFECVKREDHGKKLSKTHPVDVVFYYDDPYTGRRLYLLTDLKSYAANTITPQKVREAVIELSKSVSCASISSEWKERYINEDISYDIGGMLFIYNHDGTFDMQFNKHLSAIQLKSLKHPAKSRLFVITPDRISFLINILNDLDVERGKGHLPQQNGIPFIYPDKIKKLAAHPVDNVARIELLLGPWQLIPYELTVNAQIQRGYYIYYSGRGTSSAEFEFIFDFCFKNQLVKPNEQLNIRLPYSSDIARQSFEVAQENFSRSRFYAGDSITKRLQQFIFTPITTVVTQFSSQQIGMERRKND